MELIVIVTDDKSSLYKFIRNEEDGLYYLINLEEDGLQWRPFSSKLDLECFLLDYKESGIITNYYQFQ